MQSPATCRLSVFAPTIDHAVSLSSAFLTSSALKRKSQQLRSVRGSVSECPKSSGLILNKTDRFLQIGKKTCPVCLSFRASVPDVWKNRRHFSSDRSAHMITFYSPWQASDLDFRALTRDAGIFDDHFFLAEVRSLNLRHPQS